MPDPQPTPPRPAVPEPLPADLGRDALSAENAALRQEVAGLRRWLVFAVDLLGQLAQQGWFRENLPRASPELDTWLGHARQLLDRPT
jgi:hypothetical protein